MQQRCSVREAATRDIEGMAKRCRCSPMNAAGSIDADDFARVRRLSPISMAGSRPAMVTNVHARVEAIQTDAGPCRYGA